ncbi:MAG: putative bifunctional diguanylate cyclase/phosphodiesterase [Granulosicoccaceae bacterium]
MSPISPDQLSRAEFILRELCLDQGKLCLYTPQGSDIWSAPDNDSPELASVDEQLIKDEQEQTIAIVRIFWRGEIPEKKLQALTHLVDTWSQECALVRELDEMADELAERYEELNLLYKPSKKNSDRNNDTDQVDLLLSECVSKLNLDQAIALQSDFGLFHAAYQDGSSPLYSEREYTSLLRESATQFADSQVAIVMNAGTGGPNLGPIPDYHAVFCPVQPSPSNTIGGLWFFRKAEAEKFFNSDSRIATNIASEITGNLVKHHDTTTGLLNRSGFEKSLQALIDTGSEPSPSVVAYINIQRFSIVNDHGGYIAGDLMLKHFATLLNNYFRETDIVARLVADEFVVLLKNCNPDQAIERLTGFIELVSINPFSWQSQSFPISLAVGLTPLDTHGSANVCIKEADAACELAAQTGANQIRVFDGKDQQYQRYASERQMIPQLHTALAENQFELYAQPIFAIHQGWTRLSHAEILIRLRDKDGEMIPPGEFVPVAERFGLMSDIDMWIVEHSIDTLAAWQSENPTLKTKLSINLSGRTLTTDYASELLKLLENSVVSAEQICFEITETAALIDMDTAVNFINRLRQQGCSFALDDFGAGLSSFSYLQNLPVDYLKIDGSFVKDIATDSVSRTFVDGINNIGHAIGLKTIAEFVTDQQVLDALAELKVDYAQGFHCGKPMPVADYFALLAENCNSRKCS